MIPQDSQFDLAIIGAGPDGYVAAIRCARLGLRTVLIDKCKALVGTCLNFGCIPSKALLHSSGHYAFAGSHAAAEGIELGEVGLNLKTVLKKKNQVVAQLTGGVNILVKRRGIEHITGHATLQGDRSILVQTETVETRIQTTNTILATGSAVVEPLSSL
ncbi:MAG: FAD-dependent oxidoreductase [Opitutales bacterium]|nr:FAD-dependent oxidoreductase [Opitutales bacterium]MBT7866834.1 FAD-dependent oxidoreductase [Opitutales bacterium]